MPTNPIGNRFTDYRAEKLYNSLIKRVIYNYGIDTQYLPRASESSVDLLFGEDPTSKFTTNYPVAVLVQSVDEFEGGELFSKFGLEVRKQARFLISKDDFQTSVASNNPGNYTGNPNFFGVLLRPREGDLLWMKNFGALFEIKYVEEEYFFYTFGNVKIYGYSLVCEKFRYSNERIDTPVDGLMETVNEIIPAFAYVMANTGNTGTFLPGELVFSNTANATVLAWDLPSLTLTLKHINGEFLINTTITGANSNAVYVLANTAIINDVNNRLANNQDIENEGQSILNFDENDPFADLDMNE